MEDHHRVQKWRGRMTPPPSSRHFDYRSVDEAMTVEEWKRSEHTGAQRGVLQFKLTLEVAVGGRVVFAPPCIFLSDSLSKAYRGA